MTGKVREKKGYSVVKFRLHYVNKGLSTDNSALPTLHTLRLDPVRLCMTDLAEPAIKAVFHRSRLHLIL